MEANIELKTLIDVQRGIVSRRQLLAVTEMTDDQICWLVKPNGRWQVMLPGVYATFTGEITSRQWWQAGLLYAREGSVLTGEPALVLWGITEQRNPRVPILVPHERHRASRKQISIFRTERMPDTEIRANLLVAVPTRALVDACRIAPDLDRVRGLMTEGLRSPRISVDAVAREIREGPRRGSRRLRHVLMEYSDGARSAAEAIAREKILELPLPIPLFNPMLFTRRGEHLGQPDVYWPDAGLIFEVDSTKHHGDKKGLEYTQRRHSTFTAYGFMVMHASPARIMHAWEPIGHELIAAHRIGLTHERIDVIINP